MANRKQIAGGAIGALLLVATPLIASWEGKSNTPYADRLAGGLMTVCFGETRVQMRRYSDEECKAMLQDGILDFAEGVAQRNPELIGHPNQWAAATSLAYNTGLANYRRSTVARRFSDGRWASACNGLLAWRFAGGKEIKGLLNRRKAEREVCLRDIPADKAR